MSGATKRIGRPGLSDEEAFVMANGASIAQIARHINTKPETLRLRIVGAGLKPTVTISGVDRYDLIEVGKVIAEPTAEQFERYMKTASHHDVPPMLMKAMWDGIEKRNKVELTVGELWHTEEVVAGFGNIGKIVKMACLTMSDHLHRQMPLSHAQRRLVDDLMADALSAVQEAIRELFSRNPNAAGEAVAAADEPVADGVPDPTWDL